jgi:hypothetical protein
MPLPRALIVAALVAALAGCGDGGGDSEDPVGQVPESVQDKVRAAAAVDPSAFPAPAGRGLEEIASEFEADGPQAATATSLFRVGRNRLAFGLLDENLRFAYGKTVVYVAPRGGGDVIGPVAAPADVLLTQARYRSRQAATDKDPFAAIYAAELDLRKPGVWNAVVVSDLGAGRRIAAGLTFEVKSKRADEVPDVGEKAPRVATDTLASVKGDDALLDTRVPPAPELHRTSFAEVAGRKPAVLLFATPALCQSRVCGPVVDEALQLQARYGDRVEFIHQEVYVDNRVDKGLRAPLRRFALETEPWLFTVRADGTIAARLEGSFGLAAFEDAIKAAL